MNYEFNKISTNAPRASFLRRSQDTVRSFSITEKIVFFLLVLVAAISGLSLLSQLNSRYLVVVPDYGGSITEGVVGVPRFVNPVLAISDADRDVTSLVFSGLLKATPDNQLVNDLSQSHTVSEDGRTYSFTLRENIYFHDGKPVTTDDVEYTIQRIQDPTTKSPERSVWDGVQIQKIDSKTISFTLRQPYAPFINNFTVGIIPRHIWREIPSDEFSFSEINTNAIGSGPYKISKVRLNSHGLPNSYQLEAFDRYSLGRPFIKRITLRFYQNENDLIEAFESGDINSLSGVSAESIYNANIGNAKIQSSTLPRVFGIFFNQNQAGVFLNKEVREALNIAVDKERIVEEVLHNYASVIDSPVPLKELTETETVDGEVEYDRVSEAISILVKAGWALNQQTGVMEKTSGGNTVALSFSLSTGDAVELKRAGELIKEDLEKIGASVDLKVFEIGDLNQNVIRPRKFDALLFGEVVGREFDLYPFWHSSQRNDPGLNIALYANITADKILEDLRTTQDRDERKRLALEFDKLFMSDMPAVFIYSPHFIYAVPDKLRNVSLGEILYPGERFLNVHEWYMETNNVWKIFI